MYFSISELAFSKVQESLILRGEGSSAGSPESSAAFRRQQNCILQEWCQPR